MGELGGAPGGGSSPSVGEGEPGGDSGCAEIWECNPGRYSGPPAPPPPSNLRFLCRDGSVVGSWVPSGVSRWCKDVDRQARVPHPTRAELEAQLRARNAQEARIETQNAQVVTAPTPPSLMQQVGLAWRGLQPLALQTTQDLIMSLLTSPLNPLSPVVRGVMNVGTAINAYQAGERRGGVLALQALGMHNAVSAINAYQAGERRPLALISHATGLTNTLIGAANFFNQWSADARVVFSNAPWYERLPHAVRMGATATATAATIVGAGQLAYSAVETATWSSISRGVRGITFDSGAASSAPGITSFTAGATSAARPGSGQPGSMNIERTIARGERLVDLLDELKMRTFQTGNEHAIVRLTSEERVIVSGSPHGVRLSPDVETVYIHTHPYQLPATGPSAADFTMLYRLEQTSSWLLEHGLLTKFGILPTP